MKLPSADAYIFDIDGTLLVTKDLVHWNALHQAMIISRHDGPFDSASGDGSRRDY